MRRVIGMVGHLFVHTRDICQWYCVCITSAQAKITGRVGGCHYQVGPDKYSTNCKFHILVTNSKNVTQ